MNTPTVPRLSMVTLGVADLDRSVAFYRQVFGIDPHPGDVGVAFFQLPGTWVALYPLQDLARDIGPDLPAARSGFSGITLAHNEASREGVLAFVERARAAGAVIVKPPEDTFWGGFSGYFTDPDGYHWEIAWGPMFEFGPDGALQFRNG